MKSTRRLAISALIALLFVLPVAAAESAFEARLESLAERLEEQRTENHIPGMSFALIKDGKVVFARGFGVTDLESNDAVTTETLFMIGSTTKAFTAALAGMLVDEGKLGWDEPVATYLPYFDPEVVSENSEAKLTLRDALSHRTGFTRMSPILTGDGVSTKERLQVASNAKPSDPLRSRFQYTNVMYLASGEATAAVANTDWHSLIKKRIFKPLKMKSTSSRALKNNRGLIAGYQWNASEEALERQPILPIDTIAPAGAIISNADDMSRWLTMLLAGGQYNGKRLIQPSTLEEMWTTQVHIADGIGYGLGWFTRDWEGHRYLEHGGNINGFAAQIGLLPDDGIGFVLLTNLTATPLQGTVGPLVWDELLGEDQPMTKEQLAEAGSADAEDLSLFVGSFVANFGAFNDADFEVTEKDGVLFVNVPGQTNYEIKPPNDDGRRPFAMTDTIAVSFERNATGGVDIMRMHQGGLDFELPRRGYTPPAEIDEAELLPFLGKYKSNTFASEVSLILRNGRLAIDVPGQMVFELRLPGEDGRRRFRVRDVMSVEFENDEAGAISGMALRRGDELIETIPRTGGPDGEPLPTLDELMALRATDERRAAQKNAGVVYTLSDANFVNAGLEATISEWSEGATFRTDVDLGKFGWSHTLVTPESGVTLSHITPEEEFGGRRLRTVHDASRAMRLLDWRDGFEKVQILKREEIDGTPTIRVMLRNPDSPPITVYCDEKTGDVLRLEASLPIPAANAEIPLISTLSDYRDVNGLRIPYKMSMHNSQTGITEITIREVKTGMESCPEMSDIEKKSPCIR